MRFEDVVDEEMRGEPQPGHQRRWIGYFPTGLGAQKLRQNQKLIFVRQAGFG